VCSFHRQEVGAPQLAFSLVAPSPVALWASVGLSLPCRQLRDSD
jgi:hypothetical protein